MKKAIISAALMATSLLAAAQVTVYGRVNATVDSTKTGANTVNSIVNDASRIGFSAAEDLEQGLRARAVIETSVNSNDPAVGNDTQLGNRHSTVGLSTAQGSVDLGRQLHGVFSTLADADAFGAGHGSLSGDVHNLRSNRLGNAVFVRWDAMPGVKLGMDRTHTASGSEATVLSASAKLAGVTVGAAQFEQGRDKSTVATAGVHLGTTHVHYSYSDNRGTGSRKGHLVGVRQQLGVITAKASVGRTNTDVVAYNVGAEYALSKRTDLLVVYRNVNAAGSVSDISQVAAGITHRF